MIAGPGSRPRNVALSNFYMKQNCLLLARSADLDCIPACAVNAVSCRKGSSAARITKDVLISCSIRFRKLGSIGPMIHILRLGFRVIKLGQEFKSIKWLKDLKEGVWITRMLNRNRIDHCVSIDGNRICAPDSEEQFPLKICEDFLKMCGGGFGVNFVEVFHLIDTN